MTCRTCWIGAYPNNRREGDRKATGGVWENYGVLAECLRAGSKQYPKGLGGGHEAMRHSIFHQVGGGVQIEQLHNLGFVKLDGAMRDL